LITDENVECRKIKEMERADQEKKVEGRKKEKER